MNGAAAILEIAGLTSGYGEGVVVRDVDIAVAPGEIVVLLGKNGMGKSTLLKTIMGFLPARGGSVRVEGQEVTRDPPHRIARRAIAYTPQEQAIFQDLTVAENLRLGLAELAWFDEEFERVCGTFPFLRERTGQRAGTLSGGEQKMLLVARALMSRPKLMLVDEITEGLQPSIIERLSETLLSERARTGVAMLLVEQNIGFALEVADRWAVLKLGEIVDRGGRDEPDRVARVNQHLSV